jgi:cysteine desulfurase
MQTVYLDNAATTPLDPAVLEAMRPYLTEHFGNPSSVHALGRKAKVALEDARDCVATVLNCEPAEVIFTSGGTESDNVAIRGVLGASEKKKGLVTSAAEHEAVLRTAEALAGGGGEVDVLEPKAHGSVSTEHVAQALAPNTGLVSIMFVNNEVGTISPVREIADIAHEHGALVHTDAVQAAGMLSLDVDQLGVDLLSLSGHKIYGPKGVGVLYVRAGTPFVPQITGGAQERRRRGGTENVAAIVGFAEALERVDRSRQTESVRLRMLQKRLAEGIRTALGDSVQFNTPLDSFHHEPQPVAPHILNVSLPPVAGRTIDGEMLLLGLDVAGVYVSGGSACTSGAIEPSHVLLAMGVAPETAAATVRFSLGRITSVDDIDFAIEQLTAVVERVIT